MISTLILMKTVAVQTSVRPASADRVAAESISFAQSLDERFGGVAEIPGTKPSSQMTTVNEEPPKKIAEDDFTVLPEMAGRAIATGVAPEHVKTEGAVREKLVSPQSAIVPVPRMKAMARDPQVNDIYSPPETRLATVGSSDIPQEAKDSSSHNVASSAQVNVGNQLLSPYNEGIFVEKEPTRARMISETVPVEKDAKSPPDKAIPLALNKVVTVLRPIAIAAGSGSDKVAQGSNHFIMGNTLELPNRSAVFASAVPRSESASTSAGDLGSIASATGKSFPVGQPATKDSLVQKNVSGRNPTGVDMETVSPVVGDQVVSVKHSTGVGELLSAAIPASGDSDGRTENTSGFAIALAHTVGNATGAFDTVAMGNTAAGSSVKLASGETGVQITAPSIEFREQDSSGGVDGSLDRMPQMLTATPTALEVGIQNGTHGWLKVRAEMTDTGAVNASVSASSTIGQEMLHRELPSLTAYLQSEKVTVNAVVVHTAATDSRGSTAGMDSRSDGQAQYRGDDGGENHKGLTETASDGAGEAVSYESSNLVDENEASPLMTYVGGVSWLSIRA